ncbi:hypothetical protein IT575_11895 [bacterium]|nr:hypothetical protein [bacterium]
MPYTPAESAWNVAGPDNSFGAYPQPSTYTFLQAYNGNNFDLDFAKAKRQWAEILGVSPPNWGGEDLLDATLQECSMVYAQ